MSEFTPLWRDIVKRPLLSGRPLYNGSNSEDSVFTTPRTSNTIEDPTDADLLALELRDRLTVFQKKSPAIKKTPVIYINSHTSPAGVQDWLMQKGFDNQTRHYLKTLSGEDMFNLTKEQLQKFCGHEEGHRLYSQLVLSRTVTEYNPSKSIELCEKLAKAKEKADKEDE